MEHLGVEHNESSYSERISCPSPDSAIQGFLDQKAAALNDISEDMEDTDVPDSGFIMTSGTEADAVGRVWTQEKNRIDQEVLDLFNESQPDPVQSSDTPPQPTEQPVEEQLETQAPQPEVKEDTKIEKE